MAVCSHYELITVSKFRILQTILMGKVITYFTPGSGMMKNEARIYGGAMVAVIFIRLAFDHQYNYLTSALGMRVRVACCSLVYRKVRYPDTPSRSGKSVHRMTL